MQSFDKMIKVSEGRIIRFNTFVFEKNEVEKPVYSIEEFFIEHDEIQRSYRLCKNGGYEFYGWINTSIATKEIMESLTYDFDEKHPFYVPLLHFLGKNDKIQIEDEKTQELNKKYIIINNNIDKVSLIFINNITKDEIDKKFNIAINSTEFDSNEKSEYSNTNIKKRLEDLFDEIIELIIKENQNDYEEKKQMIKRKNN